MTKRCSAQNLCGLFEEIENLDKEYSNAISSFYDFDLFSFVRDSDNLALTLTQSDRVKTLKSKDGSLILRWAVGNNKVIILGLVTTTGKILNKDVVDLEPWFDSLVDKMRKGYEILCCKNRLSSSILNVLKRKVPNLSEFGGFKFGPIDWINLGEHNV